MIAKDEIIRMILDFITCENVSWKSNPCYWWKPFATSLTLYLLTPPSIFSFTLNTHVHLIGFLLDENVDNVQVSFFNSDSYSDFMASYHLEYGWACCVIWFNVNKDCLGLYMLVLALVIMGWLLSKTFDNWFREWNDGDKEFVEWPTRFCDKDKLVSLAWGCLGWKLLTNSSDIGSGREKLGHGDVWEPDWIVLETCDKSGECPSGKAWVWSSWVGWLWLASGFGQWGTWLALSCRLVDMLWHFD